MADEENGGAASGSGNNGPAVIVVKKKARGHGHGHHGGAWKVAYADFVTAMMAFFLLLWLLSSTTEEQKVGIAYYFNPPSDSSEYGGGTGIMKGSSVVAADQNAPADAPMMPPPSQSDSQADMAVQAKEDAMFRQVSDSLKKAVMNVPELKTLMDNMIMDVTPEGLRITITDSRERPLFENGSAAMFDYTRKMLGTVTSVLLPLPNKLAIGGHTDVVPYRGANPVYTNWDLSTDRAQATRRTMMQEGLPERRLGRVAGYASQQPLLVDQPEAIKNRRITIIILRSNQGTIAQFSQEGLIAPHMGPTVY